MRYKETFLLILRYFTLLLFAAYISIFYKIFTPATIYPVFWILNSLYGAKLLEGHTIFFNGYYAEIIPACVAGAAYFLLLILNLSTPMHFKKRIKSLIFLNLTFLILNIIRIVVFALLLPYGYKYFDLAHTLVWYFGSTILIILVWFGNVGLFKINTIPVYTDFRDIYKDISKYLKSRKKARIKRKIKRIESLINKQ